MARRVENILNEYYNGNENLNKMQKSMIPISYLTNHNFVLSAPTGRLMVLEFAILKMLDQAKDFEKVLFLVPLPSSVVEMEKNWRNKFVHWKMCTLVNNLNEPFSAARIVITTFENWDLRTRVWPKALRFLENIALVIVDDVHYISDVKHGGQLESVLTRMKYIAKSSFVENAPISRAYVDYGDIVLDERVHRRWIATSATMQNIHDVGRWLGCMEEFSFKFSENFLKSMRACTLFITYYTNMVAPLKISVQGMEDAVNSEFQNAQERSKKVLQVIWQNARAKQTLVFCTSKMNASNLARYLVAQGVLVTPNTKLGAKQYLEQYYDGPQHTTLYYLLSRGIGYHHEGLSEYDRTFVERMYRNRIILILCCTASLATGINLPAYLVIVKSTCHYQGAELVEYSKETLLQMISRGGPSGLNSTSGIAVVLTNVAHQDEYRKLMRYTCMTEHESVLEDYLDTAINNEFVLHTVGDESEIIKWIKETFLYVRFQEQASERLQFIANDTLTKLKRETLISDNELPTQLGKLVSWYGINRKALEALHQIPRFASTCTLLNLLANSVCAMTNMSLRYAEKSELNLYNAKAKYPLMQRFDTQRSIRRIQNEQDKCNLILQSCLNTPNEQRYGFQSHTLVSDQSEVHALSLNLIHVMKEWLSAKLYGASLLSAIQLEKLLYGPSNELHGFDFNLRTLPVEDNIQVSCQVLGNSSVPADVLLHASSSKDLLAYAGNITTSTEINFLLAHPTDNTNVLTIEVHVIYQTKSTDNDYTETYDINFEFPNSPFKSPSDEEPCTDNEDDTPNFDLDILAADPLTLFHDEPKLLGKHDRSDKKEPPFKRGKKLRGVFSTMIL